MTKKPLYEWDDERGIVKRGKDGETRQAMQLLLGPADVAFRRQCGRLLVAALNKEAGKK